jgi:MtrB/PioB family decaheme-associated outer membrane protein
MHRVARFLIAAFGVLTATAALAQPPDTAPASDDSASLFAPRWNEVEIGGRFTSTKGDEARFQRFQDMRSGLLVDNLRVEHGADAWSLNFGADKIGYRDQRYAAEFSRPGLVTVTGLWDQTPQFYSVDTRTPYSPIGSSPMGLDDATQRAIQNRQATLTAYVPQARQFDMRERRDVGLVAARVTPTAGIDITGSFTTTKHSGELPWGATFGFSNDVEVALPYDSRTNDLSMGAEWTNDRAMVRVAYDGSWFDNRADRLVWDSPLRADAIAGGPNQGQMALWPTNDAQTVSAAGYWKFPHRTQVTGFFAVGQRTNDQPLLPYTINAAAPQLPLPRVNTAGHAETFAANLGLVSRPVSDWRFSARLRRYDYNNKSEEALIPQYINYDTSIKVSLTPGPELFAHDRTTFDGDVTWTGLQPLAVTAAYSLNVNGWDHRVFESSDEHVFNLKADAVGNQWMTFRANYEHAKRTGDGLDEEGLAHIGEQPRLRHFDVANRTRDKFTGQVDVMPSEAVTLSASAGLGNDDYPDSYFGLQEATFRVIGAAIDAETPGGVTVGGTYSFERYTGLQTSRSAAPTPVGQTTDPRRDWTTDTTEKVHYFSVYLAPPRYGNTEARVSYDYAESKGRYVYGLAPNTVLPAPSQLPEVFNKLRQFRLDVRHRVSSRIRANFSYQYEPFRVFDFAFDPSVVNSIVQPSSLVLGYVYRPYTAHSAVLGIVYGW